MEYDFRIKILCKLPPARSQRSGTNSLIFEGSLLWNGLSDEIKTAKSLAIFKQEINRGMALNARAASAGATYLYTYLIYFTSPLFSCNFSMLVLLSYITILIYTNCK